LSMPRRRLLPAVLAGWHGTWEWSPVNEPGDRVRARGMFVESLVTPPGMTGLVNHEAKKGSGR
jgi:hypothetical protein